MSATAKFNQPLPVNATNVVDQAGAYVRSAGARILNAFVAIGENSSGARKARAYATLNALSDAELAERGLNRDTLASHVFGPFYS